MEDKYTKQQWYITLNQTFTDLMHRLGIPDDPASEIKVFLLETARNQYLAGNRSGIKWARQQMGVPTN